MTFDQAYNYLLSLNNIRRKEYMKDPRDCGSYIKRLQLFLDILGNPEKHIPHYIHVAGTSGKGSVTSYLHSILDADGKTVGSTYSPHPTTVLERWRLGDRYMKAEEFIALIEEIKPKLDTYIWQTPYDMLSFYEVNEAIGLLWFARNNVEWVVLETACGGRFDSSNVIPHKDVAIITNIGLDHVGVIGDTLEEIAYEKAGIIQEGCAVYSMEEKGSIREIISKEADEKNVPIRFVENTATDMKTSIEGSSFLFDGTEYNVSAPGPYQVYNAQLCIAIAKDLGISEDAIQAGLKSAHQPLRMEHLSPTLIVDGAHNPDKITSTVEALKQMEYDRTHLILGFCDDKAVEKMMKIICTIPRIGSIACTRNTTNLYRKMTPPNDIAQYAKQHLSPVTEIEIFLDPKDALAWSKTHSNTDDILLVTGSIFVSGEIRAIVSGT